MRFPYTEVQPGRFRPMVLLRVWGPVNSILTDGLLDTGSDRIIFAPRIARALGVDVAALPGAVTARVPTGTPLPCKLVSLRLELARPPSRICWLGEVAIPLSPVRNNYWGFKGFLEYFRADFDGPNRVVTLTTGAGLPAVAVP